MSITREITISLLALLTFKSHHTMNPMGHDIPNMIGVDQKEVAKKIGKHMPGYMPMMERGIGNMHEMGRPKNTLPMMTGEGPCGPVEMGGMFTVMKTRDELPGGTARIPASTCIRPAASRQSCARTWHGQ